MALRTRSRKNLPQACCESARLWTVLHSRARLLRVDSKRPTTLTLTCLSKTARSTSRTPWPSSSASKPPCVTVTPEVYAKSLASTSFGPDAREAHSHVGTKTLRLSCSAADPFTDLLTFEKSSLRIRGPSASSRSLSGLSSLTEHRRALAASVGSSDGSAATRPCSLSSTASGGASRTPPTLLPTG